MKLKCVFFKFRLKGQVFVEYALIIASVAAFIASIMLFAQRQLSDRIRNAEDYVSSKMPGGVTKYEPYYVQNVSDTTTASSKTLELTGVAGDPMTVTTGEANISEYTNTICAENGDCDLPSP